MTLAETLQAKLSNWKPSGDGRHSWGETFAESGWAVRLTADHNDVVGSLVWELTLVRTADAPAGLTVRGWADGVASRVTGLLEPLRVIEVDATRDEAILRSTAPARKGPTAAYYEVKLTGTDRAVVRRFNADVAAGSPREQVTFALTHEVIAKLAQDVAG